MNTQFDDQTKEEIALACRYLRRAYGPTGFVRPRLERYEKNGKIRQCWIWECGHFDEIGSFTVTGECLGRYGPLKALLNAGIQVGDD